LSSKLISERSGWVSLAISYISVSVDICRTVSVRFKTYAASGLGGYLNKAPRV
jgi:hypothetical protein